jgi:hypothetical protein
MNRQNPHCRVGVAAAYFSPLIRLINGSTKRAGTAGSKTVGVQNIFGRSAMIRGLLVACVLAAFGLVMAGCHAQGSVGGNDSSSVAR